MIKEEDKQFFRLLYPQIRRCSDNDLESWYAYVVREFIEAKVEKREKWEIEQLSAWAEVLEE